MKTVAEIADIYQINITEYAKQLSEYYKVEIKATNSFQLLHDNYGIEPSIAEYIAISIRTDEKLEAVETEKNRKVYHLIPISLFLLILYTISRILLKRKVISIINHKNSRTLGLFQKYIYNKKMKI